MSTNIYKTPVKGYLVTNSYLINSKFSIIHQWFMESAKKYAIDLKGFGNSQLPIYLPGDREDSREGKGREVDFVLFWDKDIRLAKFLEDSGYTLYNSSRAIALSDDKSLTHLALSKAGIPMPKTYIAPMTFDTIGYANLDFLEEVEALIGYPCVVKECFGSFGQQVYLARSQAELMAITLKIGSKPMLFQEFIESSMGRDVRLQVVGEEVIASMYRYSDNGDFRANITAGGKMKPYEPTKEQIDLALLCCKTLGLDFAGVDILFGRDGEPLVCEVNSNAHFKNIYDCTGVNAADVILEYILGKVKGAK
ncbi:ATP-grasp domain-containing protein [Anaerocolumna xylanovorans]|uniref:Ribosomal protein S6--L-glutamate ligase n=1 Tax=Anaerocolumna xylanovorans DSM 12503 TaxID=1121345 RepID=A0A1M7YLR6_9FIRM|nr:RimK family alpha-L-glutamate ligase [Anaerocolumna xylanovorans]SHO53522.1 ribosomal protein S6--L-glutamate ligase [Anaerocolumna xylanovorans DSM 12503]